jgi:hypothetical protein
MKHQDKIYAAMVAAGMVCLPAIADAGYTARMSDADDVTALSNPAAANASGANLLVLAKEGITAAGSTGTSVTFDAASASEAVSMVVALGSTDSLASGATFTFTLNNAKFTSGQTVYLVREGGTTDAEYNAGNDTIIGTGTTTDSSSVAVTISTAVGIGSSANLVLSTNGTDSAAHNVPSIKVTGYPVYFTASDGTSTSTKAKIFNASSQYSMSKSAATSKNIDTSNPYAFSGTTVNRIKKTTATATLTDGATGAPWIGELTVTDVSGAFTISGEMDPISSITYDSNSMTVNTSSDTATYTDSAMATGAINIVFTFDNTDMLTDEGYRLSATLSKGSWSQSYNLGTIFNYAVSSGVKIMVPYFNMATGFYTITRIHNNSTTNSDIWAKATDSNGQVFVGDLGIDIQGGQSQLVTTSTMQSAFPDLSGQFALELYLEDLTAASTTSGSGDADDVTATTDMGTRVYGRKSVQTYVWDAVGMAQYQDDAAGTVMGGASDSHKSFGLTSASKATTYLLGWR